MKFTVKTSAILALIAVAFCYVLLNITIRLTDMAFDPFSQTYLRIGIGFLLALIIFHKDIRWDKIKKYTLRDWQMFVLMGTLGYGVAVIFITLSVLHTTFLNVAVIGSTIPLFSLLFTFLITRKLLQKILYLYLILTILGVYVITTKSLSPVITHIGIGEVYALFFAAGVGVYSVARKYVAKHITNNEITIIVMFIAFVCSLTGALFFGEKLNVSGFFNPLVVFGLAMAAILNVLTTSLQNFGFQNINSVAGSQVLLLENIFAPIMGYLFYHEVVLPIEMIGAVFILIGVFGFNRKSIG